MSVAILCSANSSIVPAEPYIWRGIIRSYLDTCQRATHTDCIPSVQNYDNPEVLGRA